MLLGIDVSSWQKDINIAQTGADFVIVEATQNLDYVNPYLDHQVKRTRETGKLLGLYHYAGGEDPIKEADFFVDTVRPYSNNAMLVLDWEAEQNKSFDSSSKWCFKFLSRVKQRTRQQPVIYMNAKTVASANWSRIKESGFDLWLAGYPDLRDSWDVPELKFDTLPWRWPAMWQYTTSGGTLDRNVFYGEIEEWQKYL